MQIRIMLQVSDVEASSGWYQKAFCMTSGHGGPDFEMLMDPDGSLLLQLHRLDGDEHPGLTGRNIGGDGVLLYLHVDDVDATYQHLKTLGVKTLDEPHRNELAHMREFSLKDPDGYLISVCKSEWG